MQHLALKWMCDTTMHRKKDINYIAECARHTSTCNRKYVKNKKGSAQAAPFLDVSRRQIPAQSLRKRSKADCRVSSFFAKQKRTTFWSNPSP